MHRRLLCVFVFVPFLFAFSFASVRVVDVSSLVMVKANELRSAVLCEALKFGVSRQQLADAWGADLEVFTQGLYPFTYSPTLAELAAQHLKISISSSVKLASFVSPAVSISVLGVAFENSIPEEEAFNILITALLKDALLAKPYASALLFPLYTDLGAVVGITSVSIGGEEYNVYVLVVAVGVSEDPPEWGYVVGALTSKMRAPVFWDGGKLEPVVWPNGLFYARVLSSECFLSVEKLENGRWVRDVYRILTTPPLTLLRF